MEKSQIIEELDARVKRCTDPSGRKYSVWTIGITNDVKRRREEHDSEKENTKYWKDWKSDSETDARNIEKHFLDLGMKGGGGGGDAPTYVYIF